jgi:tRNA (cmo5U34)-methyltransferase
VGYAGFSRSPYPTRAEQLDILTSVVADNYETGKRVLDIGCGSGQVEELLFKKRSDIKIVGIDSSEPMLEIAKNRLAGFGENFKIFQKDIETLDISSLQPDAYSIVFSVQVLHELNTELRRSLFVKIYKLLESGGLLIIMDRIKVDLETFTKPYQSVWNRLESKTSLKSASDFQGYKERIKNKQDSPASLEEFNGLLKETGFEPAILHLHFDRIVMVGIKK